MAESTTHFELMRPNEAPHVRCRICRFHERQGKESRFIIEPEHPPVAFHVDCISESLIQIADPINDISERFWEQIRGRNPDYEPYEEMNIGDVSLALRRLRDIEEDVIRRVTAARKAGERIRQHLHDSTKKADL